MSSEVIRGHQRSIRGHQRSSEVIKRSSWFQPSSYLILAGSAYKVGGSPGRAALIWTGNGLPETFLTTSTISST